MEIKELGHIVLSVRDLQKSAHFYRDILGFREVSRMGDRGIMFSAGRTHHELFLTQGDINAPVSEGRGIGLRHFALKVGTKDEELQSALDELRKEEVEIVHVTDHGVTHSVYLKDPDGNQVEIYIDVQPELWRENPGVVGSGSGSQVPMAVR